MTDDVFLEICIPPKSKVCRFCRFCHKKTILKHHFTSEDWFLRTVKGFRTASNWISLAISFSAYLTSDWILFPAIHQYILSDKYVGFTTKMPFLEVKLKKWVSTSKSYFEYPAIKKQSRLLLQNLNTSLAAIPTTHIYFSLTQFGKNISKKEII